MFAISAASSKEGDQNASKPSQPTPAGSMLKKAYRITVRAENYNKWQNKFTF